MIKSHDGLSSLVNQILELPESKRTRGDILKLKRNWSKNHKQDQVPTNLQVLKMYYGLKTKGLVEENDRIETLLKKRGVRSDSGIVAVQVLTKPFWCPGKCIFCPNDATMPKSYINTQPGAMRALLNQFDPLKQVYNRLLSLTLTGHKTDKIEMIVLGGTWDVYPDAYKKEFIKGLYDACNSFLVFLDHIEIDFSSDKSARYTVTEDLNITYPSTLEQSIKINESAGNRVIGLTIETRPEYVTDENCQLWRELGVTRIEMGIQTLHNDVHEANVRGHDNQAIREAMHRLRQYAFKISNHYMPGLYTSTPEKDSETFQIAFSSPYIKSDELKFYPTAVIPNTPLYDLFLSGEYTPIKDSDLEKIIKEFKTEIVPPYSRIKRLARDFDTNEVVAGANTPNLRQLIMQDLMQSYHKNPPSRKIQYQRLGPSGTKFETISKCLEYIKTPFEKNETHKITSLSGEERIVDNRLETLCVGGTFDIVSERNFVCLCTRCREYRHKFPSQDAKKYATKDVNKESNSLPFLVVRRYRSSNGEELFLSFEDSLGYLYGFVRLLLPDPEETITYEGLGSKVSMIREVHVYGTLKSLLGVLKEGKSVQHTGLGSQLMHIAESIASIRGYKAVSVISGIGVRAYYKKIGYSQVGTYMQKDLGSFSEEI